MNSLIDFDLKQLKEYDYLIGIDEVGRGCLAGPLVVCGIIMNYDDCLLEVNDSKKLSIKKREQLYLEILKRCVAYFVVEITPKRIDEFNIYQATKKAMQQVAKKLTQKNTLILSDAMSLDLTNNEAIIKGDETSYAIACASIVAKVYRDNLMKDLALQYPKYDFENNKGYGTKKHLLALQQYGYLDNVHRKSFEPIKTMCSQQIKFKF